MLEKLTLDSKLTPPRTLAALLPRYDVIEKLNRSNELSLSLLLAPAGFGKTTLLSTWYQQLKEKEETTAIWVGLDHWDADPATFLATLVSAVAKADLAIEGLSELDNLQINNQGQILIQRRLLHALSERQKDTVIIFDDYHLAASDEIDAIFTYILNNLPDHTRIVLASRTMPGFDFSKLMLQQLCNILDQDSLRFSDLEVAQLFSSFSATAEALQEIGNKTEGWPAALQMARSWLTDSTDYKRDIEKLSGRLEAISLFFAEQVFEKLPVETQGFLLKVSVVATFNGDLANAITGVDNGWSMLRDLASSNAFIVAVDEESSWFRMHQLYREFLFSRLLVKGKDEIKLLHTQAAEWYLKEGYLKEAIQHYCEAQEFDKAANIVADSGGFFRGVREGLASIKALIDSFPAHVVEQYPSLQVVKAYILQKQGHNEAARGIVRKLRQIVAVHEDADRSYQDILLEAEIRHMEIYVKAVLDEEIQEEEIVAVENYCTKAGQDDYVMKGMINNLRCAVRYRNHRYLQAATAAKESLKYYKMAGANNPAIFVSVHLSAILIALGRISEALLTLTDVKKVIQDNFQQEQFAAGLVDVLLAYVHLIREEVTEAEALAWPVMEYIERGEGWYEVQVYAFQTVIELAFSRGDAVLATAWLHRGESFAHQRGLHALQDILSYQRDDMALRGFKCEYPGFDEKKPDDLLKTDWMVQDASVRVVVEGLCQENQYERALSYLEVLIQEAKGSGRVISLVPFLILEAIIFHAMQQGDKAFFSMQRALGMAYKENYLRPFLMHGDMVSKILDRVVRSVGASNMEQPLLDFIVHIQGGLVKHDGDTKITADVLLSERERQILEGLSNGESNKIIGRRLNLSPNTVKYHLRSLYEKLGAHNRAVAVEIARKKGLLGDRV